VKYIIRGLFETDGCLYFSRIYPGAMHTYPRLEIKTNSRVLVEQLVQILKSQAFVVHSRTSKSDSTVAVYLSGQAMLNKWANEIGFSSQKNKTKHALWKA